MGSETNETTTSESVWRMGEPNFSGHRWSSATRRAEVAKGRPSLPEGDGDRLAYPMFDGLMAYFPNALAEVSNVSLIGNEQHNPGQPMHWAREKSRDHGNKIMRHLVDVGKRDARGVRHAARLAWRALALLQEEIERDGEAPPSRASVFPGEAPPRREVVTRETWGGVDA